MIVIDCETCPAPDDVLAKVKPEFKAPANYKKQEAIDAYKAEAEATWREKAALSPLTGQILAMGTLDEDGVVDIEARDELEMLRAFWGLWESQSSRMVGFCIRSFDMPFIVQRSWIGGIKVPDDVMAGRYFSARIIDLYEIWTCFNRRQAEGTKDESQKRSLENICKACGLPGKLPGMTGADFARVFAEDKERALAYLRADLAATAALAARLGVQ